MDPHRLPHACPSLRDWTQLRTQGRARAVQVPPGFGLGLVKHRSVCPTLCWVRISPVPWWGQKSRPCPPPAVPGKDACGKDAPLLGMLLHSPPLSSPHLQPWFPCLLSSGKGFLQATQSRFLTVSSSSPQHLCCPPPQGSPCAVPSAACTVPMAGTGQVTCPTPASPKVLPSGTLGASP